MGSAGLLLLWKGLRSVSFKILLAQVNLL